MKTVLATCHFAALVAICAAALLSPIVSAQAPSAGHGAGHSSATMGGGSAEMMNAMKEGHQKMMSAPMTGKTDVDFAMMMRIHHIGALQMAQAELRDGKDAKMRQMARKIIESQKKEIAQFESFLAKQGHPVDKAK